MSDALEKPADHLADLAAFVTASPSSFHAAAEVARRLRAAGFVDQVERERLNVAPAVTCLSATGPLLAWRIPEGAGPTTGFRIIGAHTDSPGFVLKPNPTSTRPAGSS